ncbi:MULTISPECIES: EsaB/YukD family protein [unclassified Clostridium]|uniref:EsaB/YukD family protein n=1 Tax=unclassified Clostridium TaxID=2614128 RepID=UPI0032165155
MDTEKIIVILNIQRKSQKYDVEVPLYITANDLVIALNEGFHLGIDTQDINQCYLKCENPVTLIKGNKTLKDFNLRDGTIINIT